MHLFAVKPYHEVRLEDIAAAAKVGKGTLYVYFESKEALYLALIREGFGDAVARLKRQLGEANLDTTASLEIVADNLIAFAFSFPDLFRVMRSRLLNPDDPEIIRLRGELAAVVERVLVEGAARGQVVDPHPAITAQFIISFVRGVALYPPEGLTPMLLREHLVRVIWSGVGVASTADAVQLEGIVR